MANELTWDNLSRGTQLFMIITFGLAIASYLFIFNAIVFPQNQIPEGYEYEEVCVENKGYHIQMTKWSESYYDNLEDCQEHSDYIRETFGKCIECNPICTKYEARLVKEVSNG